MSSEQAFTAQEIQRLRELLDIDAIRKLRMLYSQHMDSGDISALASLFAEDALCEFGPYGTWQGRQTIHDNYVAVWRDTIRTPYGSLHANVNHWVELQSATRAVGRAYLIDILTYKQPDEQPILWFALYDEAYEKTREGWQFKRVSLQFFWPERHVADGFPGPFPPSG